METNCVSGKENTAYTNSSVQKTKKNILILLLNCAVCARNDQGSLRIKNSVR